MRAMPYDGVELAGETYRTASRKVTAAAIRCGFLRPKPCEVCGRARSVHAHHEDYAKPLDITWLCRWCHVERHARGEPLAVAPAQPAVRLVEPEPVPPGAAYVIDGETWEDLVEDLRRQVYQRAQAEGFENAARRLKISTTTLWRFGRRCQKVA